MDMNDPSLNSFATLVRSFLEHNPMLIDALSMILHNIAEDIDSIKERKMIGDHGYVSPYAFKHQIVIETLGKLGYKLDDVHSICNSGKAYEVIREIQLMRRHTSSASLIPSRRALPPAKGPLIEEI